MIIGAITILCSNLVFAQGVKKWNTWNPSTDKSNYVIGQAWHMEEKNFYSRLPASSETNVRKAVWDLSRNSAGLKINFKTNSQELMVKYIVKGERQMQHMPATGVSGLDLYGKSNNGKWVLAAGKYSFGDTVIAKFKLHMNKQNEDSTIIYSLYLPLYNTISWLELSYPTDAFLNPIAVKKEKPIVVYGTSIAQGACASRPGLAWTNILERKLNKTIINLGFSGNGRLENEILDLIITIDAQLYIFDCLPNLTSGYLTNDALASRIFHTIELFHEKKPSVALLFTEHDGYMDEGLNESQREESDRVNNTLNRVIKTFREKGYKNIYTLSKAEIAQNIESTVDGTHPNDIGMIKYAEAYEKVVNNILNHSKNHRAIHSKKTK